MSSQIKLEVKPRGKPIRKLPEEITISQDASASTLYAQLSQQAVYPVHRLRVTKGSDGSHIRNSRDFTIESTGLRNRSAIYVKDLGPQVAWRTVYIIEYLGPLLIHPLVLYILYPFLYRHVQSPVPAPSDLQHLLCLLLTVHFAKRVLETIFVHRFSMATMPFAYIFRNSAHYWLLGGANLAYWVFSPKSSAAQDTASLNPLLLYGGLFLFAFGELANLNAHLVLRGLRKEGSTTRAIPSGFGFNLVTCPNYLFEVTAWVGFYLVSGLNWSVLLFLVVGAGTMAKWASGKERRYRKEFRDKYKPKRYSMLPGIW